MNASMLLLIDSLKLCAAERGCSLTWEKWFLVEEADSEIGLLLTSRTALINRTAVSSLGFTHI